MDPNQIIGRIRRLIEEEASYLIPPKSIPLNRLSPDGNEGQSPVISGGVVEWTDMATQAELNSESSERTSADAALDTRVDALEAVDNATQTELNAHKISGDHDGRYYTEAEIDGLIIPRSIVDAKGDLIVGTAADTVTRMAPPAIGQVLNGDPAAAAGMTWTTLFPGSISSQTIGYNGASAGTAGGIANNTWGTLAFNAHQHATGTVLWGATNGFGNAAGNYVETPWAGIYYVEGGVIWAGPGSDIRVGMRVYNHNGSAVVEAHSFQKGGFGETYIAGSRMIYLPAGTKLSVQYHWDKVSSTHALYVDTSSIRFNHLTLTLIRRTA